MSQHDSDLGVATADEKIQGRRPNALPDEATRFYPTAIIGPSSLGQLRLRPVATATRRGRGRVSGRTATSRRARCSARRDHEGTAVDARAAATTDRPRRGPEACGCDVSAASPSDARRRRCIATSSGDGQGGAAGAGYWRCWHHPVTVSAAPVTGRGGNSTTQTDVRAAPERHSAWLLAPRWPLPRPSCSAHRRAARKVTTDRALVTCRDSTPCRSLRRERRDRGPRGRRDGVAMKAQRPMTIAANPGGRIVAST